MDPRVDKMAQVIVNYSVAVKPGNLVAIRTSPLGIELAAACAEYALKAGGNITTEIRSDEIQETFMRVATEDQLRFVSPEARVLIENADCLIGISAPSNTRAMSSIDPSKMATRSKAMEPIGETVMRRTDEGKLRWVACAYPTQAGAQDAGMSLREYADFVYGAGLLDEPDPVAAWQKLSERQERIIEWLQGKGEIHITGPNTDLTLSVSGRTWINDDGDFNFPGGEIFTGPNEDSVNGHIQFSYPGFYAGREVGGIRLTFQDGKVVDASAATDEEFLEQMLNMDEGARRLGEFAFGTNPGIQKFTKNTLFDEKIGGTLHMALGRSYPETGGVNESALHWDIVFDLRQGSEVTVDGQPFSKDGVFQVPGV
jgi:aminopeptidase